MNWKDVRELMRLRRAGATLGDIAVMKFAMLEGASPKISDRLRALGSSCLEVDMDELRALPDGTVGREYARHLDKNGLSPLVISQAMKERFAKDPYPLRYTTTHDLMHTVTGFSTTPAGEIGLFAFMIAQGYANGSRARLWTNMALAMLFLPLHTPGMLHNMKVGWAMGKKAKILLEQPLEEYLAAPLDAVRRRLDLPDPASAGIAAGHDSLLGKWLTPNDPPQQRMAGGAARAAIPKPMSSGAVA